MSSFTFGAPPPSPKFSLSEFNGCTIIVAVGGCHAARQTQYRIQPAVRGAVVVLNGDHAGEEFHDVLFFNSRVVRQLRGIPGQAIVGLVNVDKAAQDAVELLEATTDMVEYANQWAAANAGKVEGLIKTSVEAFVLAEQADAAQAPRPFQPPTQRVQAPPPPPPPLGPNFGKEQPPPLPSTDDDVPF